VAGRYGPARSTVSSVKTRRKKKFGSECRLILSSENHIQRPGQAVTKNANKTITFTEVAAEELESDAAANCGSDRGTFRPPIRCEGDG